MLVASKIEVESRGQGCPWKFIVRVSGDCMESVVVTSAEIYASDEAAEKAALRWMRDMNVMCKQESPSPKAPAASEEPGRFEIQLATKASQVGVVVNCDTWEVYDNLSPGDWIASFVNEADAVAFVGMKLKAAPPAAKVGGGPEQDDANAANFLKRLRVDRGAIVSSADCSTMEIAFAQKERRWYVDEDGMGYVMRMKPWREECQRLIEARCNARDVSDSPAAPPAAEVGGEPNYPIPEPGTLASELGRIADYIESNDCTRSWASKFIYSIIDELPTAIANHVMRPASPSVPPVTAKGTGEQSRDEKAMAAIREHGLDLMRLEGGIFSARRWHATGPVVKNDYPFSEPADAVFDLVKKLEAQHTHKAPTHQ
jgi:hypothetical protein